MTDPSRQQPNESVALALADLSRRMEVGFTRLDGQMALLIQRHDASDARITALEREVDELRASLDLVERGETDRQKRSEDRLGALERARWPLPSVAAAISVCGLAIALYQLWSNGSGK